MLADDVVDNDSAEEEEVDNDERDLDPEEGTLGEEGREIMELVGEHKVEVDDDKDEDSGDPQCTAGGGAVHGLVVEEDHDDGEDVEADAGSAQVGVELGVTEVEVEEDGAEVEGEAEVEEDDLDEEEGRQQGEEGEGNRRGKQFSNEFTFDTG